ncbi:MAG: hypothetical protein ACOX5E_02615 [Bacilli bacterium]
MGGSVAYSHNYNGGKNLTASRSVVKQPNPERIGYSFSHWDIESFDLKFNNNISLKIELKANYIANKDTNYQV